MFAFFDSIAFLATTILGLLINLVQSLVQLFLMIPRLLAYIFAVFAYMPAFVAPFLYILIAVSILFLVLNRKGDA